MGGIRVRDGGPSTNIPPIIRIRTHKQRAEAEEKGHTQSISDLSKVSVDTHEENTIITHLNQCTSVVV